MGEVLNKDALHSWIQRAIGTENFNFTVENTTQKGEGYVGDLFFVKIDLQQPINGLNVLYLVVKTNKRDPGSIRLMQDFCKREVFFYGTVFKEYQEFLNNKKLPVLLDMVPKCYKTFSENGNEVIILENLKKGGFMLHAREEPMNIAHLKMGLKSYAKLHAMSLALKDQKREIFENMSKTCTSLVNQLFSTSKKVFNTKTPMLVETLKEAGRPDLSILFNKYIHDKSMYTRFMEIGNTISKDQAIVHGDCHNGNMMFQYKDNDKSVPLRMVLIDFQASFIHSPVLDLSYFLWMNLSPTEAPKIKDFVEYYYTEFCSYLKQLGSDADTVFPRSIFEEHLKKYLPYGFLLILALLEIFYLENEDTPAFLDETNSFFGGLSNDLKLKSRDQYLKRLVALVDTFFNGPYA
uniref:Uncharacterized protein LOC114346203 n=1 Tax=Diabrotica virgifera virgifera TaxID=50390 RepID=A0A6P7H530_DIAVI